MLGPAGVFQIFQAAFVRHQRHAGSTRTPLQGRQRRLRVSKFWNPILSHELIRCIWMYLDEFGCIWMFLDVFGCIWMYLDVFGCIWMYLDSGKYVEILNETKVSM